MAGRTGARPAPNVLAHLISQLPNGEIRHGVLGIAAPFERQESRATASEPAGPKAAGGPVFDLTPLEARVLMSGTAPAAAGDGFATVHGRPVTFYRSDLLSNDGDRAYQSLSVKSHTTPAHGTLTMDEYGTFTPDKPRSSTCGRWPATATRTRSL
jgi:hypothetical protein